MIVPDPTFAPDMFTPDVLVIGAGPAGLAAATSARARGASVVLLDSSDELGGQYWRHLPAARPARHEARLHHGWEKFVGLRDALTSDGGCRILTSAQVWAITPFETRPPSSGAPQGPKWDAPRAHKASAPVVYVLLGEADGAQRERLTFTPRAIVLATGAHDRTLPFPGWDLPGVFTAGAAQALAKGESIAVGRRVLVAGAGPFLLPVAASLTQTGSRVVAVLEANRLGHLARKWSVRPWQLAGAAGKGTELAGYAANHLKNRIPYRTGMGVVAAHGTDRVTSVTIARLDGGWVPVPGTERDVTVDAVCVGHGFTPRLELAVAAGCELSADRFVTVDEGQLTSVPGVYAAGELTGIAGVECALAEGEIAGHVASGGRVTDPHLRQATSRRRTFRAFAERIEQAHGIRGGWPAWLTEGTIICRCEEVTYGRLCGTASTTRATGLRSLKLSTRAGLGICQGRVCGRTVETLLARNAPGGALTDGVITDRRPIVSPIRIGELAASVEVSVSSADAPGVTRSASTPADTAMTTPATTPTATATPTKPTTPAVTSVTPPSSPAP